MIKEFINIYIEEFKELKKFIKNINKEDKMSKRLTQEDRVLKYIKDFGSISSRDAFLDLGVTRLSAIIFNIKRDYYVDYKWEYTKNRYGDKVKYKRYFIHW